MLYKPKPFTMTKIFIASFVGAIIMFVWSFLAWTVLPIHANTYMYTPAQDAILKTLSESNLESGTYGMPSAPTREEAMKMHASNVGKSGAQIFYLKEIPGMGASMHIW